MRGSDIFLLEDVSKATSNIRKEKLDFQNKRRLQGFAAYFSGVDVIVKRTDSKVSVGTDEEVAESTPVPVGTHEASVGLRLLLQALKIRRRRKRLCQQACL